MADLNKAIENFDNYLESEEGKAGAEAWLKKQAFQETLVKNNVERLHKYYKDNLDVFIEKLYHKYDSDKYRDKEYRLGREPMEDLYWLLLEYAKVYSKPCFEEQYINDFTGEIYYLGSYVIQSMHGQGSCIRFEKQNNPPIINEVTPNMSEFLDKVKILCSEYGYEISPNKFNNWDEEQTLLIKNKTEEVRIPKISCQEQKKI